MNTARAVASLVRHGVRVSTRTGVVAARGREAVDTVELARLDRDWRPTDRRRTRSASTLVLGYGFTPSTELARQASARPCMEHPKA